MIDAVSEIVTAFSPLGGRTAMSTAPDYDARRYQRPAHAAGTDRRQPLGRFTAAGKRARAEQQDRDHHKEREGVAPAGANAVAGKQRTPDRNDEPAPSVSQNEVNRPSTAAAKAGIRSSPMVVVVRPISGATRIPASPPSAPPSVQLMRPMSSGRWPSAAAARAFSETAVVAIPNRVNLYSPHRAAVNATAIGKRTRSY